MSGLPAALQRAGRSVAAIVAGYLVVIVVSTLIQEALLGGVSYRQSGVLKITAAAVLTPLAGVAAGYVTAAIAGYRPFVHVLPMTLAIAVESTVLYTTGRVDGPLWFESLAAATLIAGVWLGVGVQQHWRRQRHATS